MNMRNTHQKQEVIVRRMNDILQARRQNTLVNLLDLRVEVVGTAVGVEIILKNQTARKLQ